MVIPPWHTLAGFFMADDKDLLHQFNPGAGAQCEGAPYIHDSESCGWDVLQDLHIEVVCLALGCSTSCQRGKAEGRGASLSIFHSLGLSFPLYFLHPTQGRTGPPSGACQALTFPHFTSTRDTWSGWGS